MPAGGADRSNVTGTGDQDIDKSTRTKSITKCCRRKEDPAGRGGTGGGARGKPKSGAGVPQYRTIDALRVHTHTHTRTHAHTHTHTYTHTHTHIHTHAHTHK